MPTALRYAIYGVFGAVWLSGCAWLVLHQFFAKPDEFGQSRHPWEQTFLSAHGALSIASAFLLGWVMAKHASEGWQQRKRRTSGGWLTIVLGAVSVSGFMLFFVAEDAWQLTTARIHEILGLAITLFATEHWRVLQARNDG